MAAKQQKATACSNCGTRITAGLAYPYNGKHLCYNCFKKYQLELRSVEGDREALCQYIKDLFFLAEVPQNVLNQIDKESVAGKSYKDQRFAVYYYYEILGNKCSSVDLIPYVIKDQFDRAQKYKAQSDATKAKNDSIDLSAPTVRTVFLSPEDLATPNRRKKKKYDINDL